MNKKSWTAGVTSLVTKIYTHYIFPVALHKAPDIPQQKIRNTTTLQVVLI